MFTHTHYDFSNDYFMSDDNPVIKPVTNLENYHQFETMHFNNDYSSFKPT